MPDELRRQDFYTGLILCAVSLGIILESWRMPRELLGWPAYAGPGIVTGLLGLGLLGLAITLLVRAWRRPGASLTISLAEVRRYLTDSRTHRLGIMCLLSAGVSLDPRSRDPLRLHHGLLSDPHDAPFPRDRVVGHSRDQHRDDRSHRVRLQPDLLDPAAVTPPCTGVRTTSCWRSGSSSHRSRSSTSYGRRSSAPSWGCFPDSRRLWGSPFSPA